MVIPWLSRGEGSSNCAVGTSVICYVCNLYFVFQLGYNQVQNKHGDLNTSRSFNLFCKKMLWPVTP